MRRILKSMFGIFDNFPIEGDESDWCRNWND